jgi:hypothetical protein
LQQVRFLRHALLAAQAEPLRQKYPELVCVIFRQAKPKKVQFGRALMRKESSTFQRVIPANGSAPCAAR